MHCYKRVIIKLLRLVFFICLALPAYSARVSGLITDEKNEPLPFVSVFVKGTSNGTTSNLSGEYFLDLPDGNYTLIFRYIGYGTVSREITVNTTPYTLNVQMLPQAIETNTFVVTDNEEDPAYPIIRKAQAKRKYYLEQVNAYSYDSYIKGMSFLRNVPEKIMGQEIVLDGLDSNRSGIVYLSESVSKVYFELPDHKKEVMISSKVSGRSQGFSWNSAMEFQLNFYEPTIPTPITDRDIISPIAPTAMTYYKYKYLGEFMDQGHMVYQIQVTPKVTGSPLVNGIINIQDDTWRIHSLDMFITKDNGMNFLDTLNMKVIFIPVSDSLWMKGSQTFHFNFDFKLLQLKGDGDFMGVFNNYVIDPVYPKNFFNGEVVKINEESNQKSEAYWDSIRPIPLTKTEVNDYDLKDSLEVIRSSKEYKDSIDHKRNKFKFMNVLLGYTWRNSWKNIELEFSSPIREFHFNTVEGIVISQRIGISKSYEKSHGRTHAEATLRYGFNGGHLYYKGRINHRFNATNRMHIGAEGGTFIEQFNSDHPISESQNDFYTVFFEQNYMKLYEKSYAKINWGSEVTNGIVVETSLEFARRRPRTNASDLIPMYVDWDERTFASNNPQNVVDDAPLFNAHNIFKWDLYARFRFRQKYMMRPGRKLIYPYKYPTIELQYTKAIPGVGGSAPSYDFIRASVSQEFSTGILGYGEYFISYGMFLSKENLRFMDYHHFNTTQTVFAPKDELRSFWALPYYQYSTNDKYVEVHYQHHFQGWLLGKIPGIKKLKWHEVAGFHFLWTPQLRDYYEFTIGIENIFRIIRVDFVGAFNHQYDPYFSGRLKIAL